MRISDWSSDVCSSDLHGRLPERGLDCVGLAALVLGRAAPEGYGLRSGDEGQAADWLRAAGLRRVDAAREGDLALVRPGPLQLHLKSEEHTSELQSLMRISYAVFCLKKKKYEAHHIAQMTEEY